mgnify:CR=1 FL=1
MVGAERPRSGPASKRSQTIAVSDPITVQIFNQAFRISADLEDPEYVQEAAAYLDKKMREAASAGVRRPLDVAIMAAMNIAEEVLTARSKKESLLSQTDQRIDDFTRLLTDQPSLAEGAAADGTTASEADDGGEDSATDGETGSEPGEPPPTRRF